MALGVLATGRGCKPNTRDNPNACKLYDGEPPCGGGFHCDDKNHCVADTGGAGGQGAAGGDTGGNGTGGAAGSSGLGGTPADGGMGGANHCDDSKDCNGNANTTICDTATNSCVECTTDSNTCTGTKTVCNANSCVECTTDSNPCPGTTPACDPTMHRCVECAGDTDCKTAEKSFCSGNVCVGCSNTAVDSTACGARDLTKAVCGASGACVACDTDKDCHGATPFCGAQKTCVSCSSQDGLNTSTCAGVDATKPFCGDSGACVECGADKDCASPTKPFCSAGGTCVACNDAAVPRTCAMLSSAKPQCSSATGACVECLAGADCADATPVCSATNTCGACTSDTDCTNRGPGVCMSHLDGRCASTKETIFVQNDANCADAGGPTAGTSATPFCSLQPTTALIVAPRDLIVVRGTVAGATNPFASSVSIVGQSGAFIGGVGSPALHVTAGTTYVRNLKLSASDSVGLQADSGSTVQLDHVLVAANNGQANDGMGGGILLNGAAFDIRNTTVSMNGPGLASGAVTWGGILVNSPPASGPKTLQLVTVQGNNATGIACTGAISGTGVLATGNTSIDIQTACNITPCTPASTMCGAQP